MESNSSDAARDALAAVAAGRAAAADRLITPWWYHPALGLLVAGYIVAFTVGDTIVRMIAIPIFFGGLAVLIAGYKRITGLWISGFSAGRASWWAVAMGIVVMVLIGLAYALYSIEGLIWPAWVAAGCSFIAVNVFGRLFDNALRASLRAGTVTVPR